jgi:hypothetical protein
VPIRAEPAGLPDVTKKRVGCFDGRGASIFGVGTELWLSFIAYGLEAGIGTALDERLKYAAANISAAKSERMSGTKKKWRQHK